VLLAGAGEVQHVVTENTRKRQFLSFLFRILSQIAHLHLWTGTQSLEESSLWNNRVGPDPSISHPNYFFTKRKSEINHSASIFLKNHKFPTPGSNRCVFSQTIGLNKISLFQNALSHPNADPKLKWK
jgi:hypothetical protein